MTDSTPEVQLHDAVCDLLVSGPTPLAALVARLDDAGSLDALRGEGLDDDELSDEVLDEATVDDAVWATPDGVLALSDQLVDGLVLTHRLTAAERAEGAVLVTPDLVILDWNCREGLDLAGGGRLSYVHEPPEEHVRGEDHATFVGPPGWLSPFDERDLLAFTRIGGTVTVVRVEDGAPREGDAAGDAREVELLRVAAEARIPPGAGEEAAPLVLDALVHDQAAFRRPVRPLGELLESAGLERRGFSFGRAGEAWQTRGEAALEHRVRELGHRWGFDTCCTQAFTEVRTAFDAFRAAHAAQGGAGRAGGAAPADGEPGTEPDARRLGVALAHGGVAPAFAQLAVEEEVPGAVLGRFADALVTGSSGRHRGAALLLAAAAADLRSEPLTALALLHDALVADPDYGPAALALADYEIDRGDLGRALRLLRHPDLSPGATALEVLAGFDDELNGLYRSTGRNDPCPCGSGRKFKACCQRNPRLPLASRLPLLLYKVSRFAGRSDHESRLVALAVAAVGRIDEDLAIHVHEMVGDRFIFDLAIFEGGLAARYLEERGALLPVDERELLGQLTETPRRLWEVAEVSPGVSLTLRDDATGEVVVAAERSGSRNHATGDLIVARIARLPDRDQLVGIPVRVHPAQREETRNVLAGAPDARQLAGWYGGMVAAAAATGAVVPPRAGS